MESREEVASSYTRTGESFSTALAMATLCFSPPTYNNTHNTKYIVNRKDRTMSLQHVHFTTQWIRNEKHSEA